MTYFKHLMMIGTLAAILTACTEPEPAPEPDPGPEIVPLSIALPT